MARPTWKGTLGFGFLTIPVAMLPTEKPHGLDFDLLDRRDMGPVGYKKVNKMTGKEVPPEQIVKAYEWKPGKYVTVEDQDFEYANVEANRNLELHSFVDPAKISPLHYEKGYLLEPDSEDIRTYELFRKALAGSGKVGIGTVVFHGRQHLGAIVAWGDALWFEILRFTHELKAEDELLPETLTGRRPQVKPQEIRLAEKLIDSMSGRWKPEEFKDSYRADLLALIEKKAKTGKSEPAHLPPKKVEKGANVIDLVELLRRSLAAHGGKEGTESPRRKGASAERPKKSGAGAQARLGAKVHHMASAKPKQNKKASTRGKAAIYS